MDYVDASLQHGLLYDLTARRTLENVQERTVAGWQHRFAVDVDQARRVRALALQLLDAVSRAIGVSSMRSCANCSVGPPICTRSG